MIFTIIIITKGVIREWESDNLIKEISNSYNHLNIDIKSF